MGLLDKFEKEYNDYIDNEFKKTWRVVKKIFKENNWTRPRDWKDILDWHYFKYKSIEGAKRPSVKDKNVFLEWAKDTQAKPENRVFSENENKFNQMPMDVVRQHFRPLIEKKNPKKKVWMTNEDFDIFLRRSFGGETDLPKPKITLCYGAKYALVKLFYQFYDKCQAEDYNQNRNKDPFLNLLKEAFSTKEFDDLDTSNFKDSNSKYEWN